MCHMEPLVCHQAHEAVTVVGSSGAGISGRKGKPAVQQALVQGPGLVTAGVTVPPLHCSLHRS